MKINRLAVFLFGFFCLFVCLFFVVVFLCLFFLLFFFFFFFFCFVFLLLLIFFVVVFFLFCFVFVFQQISDRQSLFPLEETLKYWVQIIIFLRKEQNITLALNLRDSSLRIKTFIRVSKS